VKGNNETDGRSVDREAWGGRYRFYQSNFQKKNIKLISLKLNFTYLQVKY